MLGPSSKVCSSPLWPAQFDITWKWSRSPPLYQAGLSYSLWQDCQLGSGTSLYCSQGRVKEKSQPISASKVQQTHILGHAHAPWQAQPFNGDNFPNKLGKIVVLLAINSKREGVIWGDKKPLKRSCSRVGCQHVGPPKDLQEGWWVTAPREPAGSRYQGGRIRSNQVSITSVDIYGSQMYLYMYMVYQHVIL